MINRTMVSIAVAGCLATAGAVNAAEEKVADALEGQVLDQEGELIALTALATMSSYLRSLDRYTVSADISKDEVLLDGQKLQFDRNLKVTVNGKDKLFGQMTTPYGGRQYYYDGKQFTVYMPTLKYYASFDAPDTIGKTITAAQDKHDIEFPLADLFLWGSKNADFNDIENAKTIGIGMVDGVSCNHFAFRQEDVDWQLCIKRGGNPLPLKLVITTKSETEQPQYVATMKWDLAPVTFARNFSFSPHQDDHQIKFGNDITSSASIKKGAE